MFPFSKNHQIEFGYLNQLIYKLIMSIKFNQLFIDGVQIIKSFYHKLYRR